MKTASDMLEGMELNGGWTVIEKLERPASASGANFSTGYIVESEDGRQGFLKALDWARAMRATNPVEEVKRLTNAFDFEQQVLEKCRDRRMSKVVLAIDDGTVTVEEADGRPVVPYLIFELAEADVRSEVEEGRRYELYWILRSLRDIATGLKQLHSAMIAHQDVKPSNVLLFERGDERKLADLGRAAYRGHSPPHDELRIQGDPQYAPPELLYGEVHPDWTVRRFGCDIYHLGSMAVFFFMGQGTTTLLVPELDPSHLPNRWPGDYRGVLPYVRDAFGKAMREVEAEVPEKLRGEMMPVLRQLCEPDPHLRGHPMNRSQPGNQYKLTRYVSRFNLLSNKAAAGFYR